MKYIVRLFFILCAAGCLPLHAQSIEALLRERVDAGETPGIVAAVYRDGKTSYHVYGLADVAGKKPVDSKTLFEIGSITKTFTTIAVAQLAEEGKISLNDPVQKFLPSTVTIPTRGDKAITFLDLATAHSGLPRMPDNFKPGDNDNPYIDYTVDNLFAFLNGYKLTRDIGMSYEYSNLGMGLLGVIVGRIDEKPYAQSVSKRILSPLKMKSTFLNTPDRKDKNSAVGYSGQEPVKSWTWTDQSCMQSAGGLLSNAEDMMKYLLANMNPDNSTLGRAMAASHQSRSEAGRSSIKIGLGWHIRNKIVWHNGGTGGFRSFAGFDPEKKMAVVVLTNSSTGADDVGFHILDESIPLKTIRKYTPVASDILMSYVGTYEIVPTFQIEITTEKGQLFAQATNQSRFEVYGESEVKFFFKVVDAQIEFIKKPDGSIEKLVLYQNGQAQNAMKVK